MYLGEVSPNNGIRHQEYDDAASKMFVGFLGEKRPASTLNVRDWDRFIRDRSTARIGPGLGPWTGAGERTVQKDLSFLRSVLDWATIARGVDGEVLLERNPLKGLPPPKEKNPRRIVLTKEDYEALLEVVPEMDWRFQVAFALAYETGHRIGAIRKLRWSDVDFGEDFIRWRAEAEKTGYGHVTPMTEDAKVAFENARRHAPGIGDSLVLPSAKDASQPISRYLARDWWKKAEKLAGLEPKWGRGWHSVRRKFATDLMHQPLKVLCKLGGWKDTSTVLQCYQHPDQGEMREALEDRKRASGSSQ